MRAAKKAAHNIELLQDLVPLNALSRERFGEIVEKIVIEVVKSGRILFRKGERDDRTIYLLEGTLEFIDENARSLGAIAAGSEDSLHPIRNRQPRPVTARVKQKAVIAWIDSRLLDAYLTWDQFNTAEVVEHDADETGDWMSRLLKIDAFSSLPPATLQGLLMRMKPYPVQQGDEVISQGEEGEYFYTIHEGRCEVTRREDDGTNRVLAELGEGDSFGEEALVSEVQRNATITMLTDGQLMRLAKQDFNELLKKQRLRYVDYKTATKMVDEGAVWLDVRTPDEYERGSFEDSVNLPVASLRSELPELIFNTSYVICCDSQQCSDSAAFVLSHKGFDVYVLKGRVSTHLPGEHVAESDKNTSSTAQPADKPAQAVPDTPADNQAQALRQEVASLQEQNVALEASLATERTAVARMTGQIEKMRSELDDASEQNVQMNARISEHAELEHSFAARIKALQEQGQARLDEMQRCLTAEQEKVTNLEQQVAAEAARREAQTGKTQQDQQEQLAIKQQLEGELAAARGQVAALEGRLQDALTSGNSTQQQLDASVQELREENDRLSKQVASMQAANAGLKNDLEAATEAGEDQQREQDGKIDVLGEELAAAQATIETLRAEHRELLEQQQAAEQRLQAQADEATALESLRRELEAEQQGSAELGERLQQVEQAHAAAVEESAEKVDQLADATAQQQALTDQLAVLQATHGDLQSEHLQALEERDALQVQLEQEKTALRSRLEELTVAADERQAELQAQLDNEQQRSLKAEQQLGDRDQQIMLLQQAATEGDKVQQLLDEEIGQLQQQLDEARELLQQREDHARSLETEYAESISKSHDELTRKNETEKELQGQIDRLRKKLEQVSQDNQKSRESSLDDLDNLREELHHERQARTEERAQMAARQRELKEQLAAIATQHEANMTNQSGAIEEARDAAREEERSRMQSIMDAHAETEERLVQVQAELQRAHEEIAVLDQQEKARRQIEIDAIQQQKEQAEAAITQLEKQLKQLTQERDGALEEQHELRVKMNSLRGEVEVARGLMAAGGQGRLEDSEQLRAELEETRKNVKIAVRLRSEAEVARDRMAAELQRLRSLSAEEQDDGEPLHIPSLDKFDPHAIPAAAPATDSPLIPEAAVTAARAMGGQEGASRGKRPAFMIIAGLLVVGVTGLFAWMMSDSQIPQPGLEDKTHILMGEDMADVVAPVARDLSPLPETPVADPDRRASSATQTADEKSAAVDVEIRTSARDTSSLQPPVADTRNFLDGTSNTPPVEAREGFVGSQPLPIDLPADPAPNEQVDNALVSPSVADGSPPVGRSFRDSLSGGGKGPAMVELLPATFQMGSPGNSLNFDEGPRHTVKLEAFSISKREISFAEYDRFARATGRRLPFDESWGRGKRPVINVSWHDAVAYTRWLSKKTGHEYRLPSEAQWEYAARAGSVYSYWWADPETTNHANCFDCGSRWDGEQTAPVASFPANRFGLYDMSGNVQEWTEDCYHSSYAGAPVDGSAWVSSNCTQRVVRGGAYSSPLDSLRSAKRGQLSQDTRLDNLGFRVVRIE